MFLHLEEVFNVTQGEVSPTRLSRMKSSSCWNLWLGWSLKGLKHAFIYSFPPLPLLWSVLASFVSWWGRWGTAAAALLIQFSYTWKIVSWSCCKEACFFWSSALQPTCSKCQFCDVPNALVFWSNWGSFICKSVGERERESCSNQWRYRFLSRGIARRSLWHLFRWRKRWLLQQLLPTKDRLQRRHLLLLLQQKNALL